MYKTFVGVALSTAVAVLPLHSSFASATTFQLADNYVGQDFLRDFEWQTFDDPTHGRVDYVDQVTARAQGLTGGTLEYRISLNS